MSTQQMGDLPGPRNRFPGDLLIQFWTNPLDFLVSTRQRYGNRARFALTGRPQVLLSNPDDINEVVITKNRSFRKSDSTAFAKETLGKNLLTGEGSYHLRRRQLMMPAFHSERLSSYANIIVTVADKWQKNQPPRFETDIRTAMLNLTANVVGKALFNVEVDDILPTFREKINEITPMVVRYCLPGGPLFLQLPLPSHRRYHRARAEFNRLADEILRRHAETTEDRGDVVSMLMKVRDETGQGLSPIELRDEVKAMFVAGHETTGSALAFAWILLAQHPAEEQALADELKSVLGDRPPTYADLPRLTYARAVFAETLRLYPSIWLFSRIAVEDVSIGTLQVPKGTEIFMSPWASHRNPDYFEDPLRFQPSRWLKNPDLADCPAYFPFSRGARSCIGEGLAWLEGILVLATLVPHFKLELNKDFAWDLEAKFALRQRSPVMMKGTRR